MFVNEKLNIKFRRIFKITPDWIIESKNWDKSERPFIKGKFFYMPEDNGELRKYRYLGKCENERALKLFRIKP